MIQAILISFRSLRAKSPLLRWISQRAREPWYRLLEAFFRRGVPVTIEDGSVMRVHPRLLGMRPEAYEPEVCSVLQRYVRPGAFVLDIGAQIGILCSAQFTSID